MKIVIDIPEDYYNECKRLRKQGIVQVAEAIITNGTPLPKGHGRLIDADELKSKLSDKDYITCTHEYGEAIPVEWVMSAIENAPTVEKPINDLCNAYCKNCHAIYKSNECEDCVCAQVLKLLNRR